MQQFFHRSVPVNLGIKISDRKESDASAEPGRPRDLKWKRVKDIMALGISGFMMQFTNGLVQIFCNSTLHIYGGDIYVGVMTVLNSVRDIATMMVHGLTNGASPVMSFNYGEKAFGKVKQAIKFVTVVMFYLCIVCVGTLKICTGIFYQIV